MIHIDEESVVTILTEEKIVHEHEDIVDEDGYVKRITTPKTIDVIKFVDGKIATESHPIKVIRIHTPDGVDTYYEHEKDLLIEEIGEPAILYIELTGWQ